MAVSWHNARVMAIYDHSPRTKSFWLRIDDPNAFREYTPGQFITLDLPIDEKRQRRWRSYSIANVPETSGEIELCISRLENGAATTYLFENVKCGDDLTFKGPAGAFVLRDLTPWNQIVMICTGTGVAPFRSMLLQWQKQGPLQKEVHLIFGTRYISDILYREEFSALEQSSSNFEYTVCLSKEPTWPGFKGRLHQVYLDRYSAKSDHRLFLICGWSNMVDEVVANLQDLGYEKGQIRYELYG